MFFDTFKELCENRGVSPKRAVTEMGLSNSLATKWKKTGATPSGETLEKIADYFEVTVDCLLGKSPGDDELKFALWDGDTKDITDEMLDEVKSFARFVKERERKKNVKTVRNSGE